MDSPLSKVELRRSLLQARRSMPTEEWRHKSNLICSRLQASALFAASQTTLAYFSFRQEPDLSPLFTDTCRRWGFPRCVGDTLRWHVWTPKDAQQQTGTYGIPEPCPTAPALESTDVDLILIPAVACDAMGYRLGYGGGYYDRLLSLPQWASKPTIGIVFEFAYLPQLQIDSWDRPLQGVCTETALRYWG